MPQKKQPEPPPQLCRWCDEPVDTHGHVVDPGGKVIQCPHIDMIVGGDDLSGMR